MSNKSRKPIRPRLTPEVADESVATESAGQGNQALLQELFDKQHSPAIQSARAAGMFQDLQYPLFQGRPGDQAGTKEKYNLSFRDKSGYKGPTSEAFLNKARGGSKRKGSRFDHGPNVKTNGQSNGYGNQKGAMNAFGQPDHAVTSPANAKVTSALKRVKPASRGAMFVGAGMDAFSVGSEAHQSMQTGDWGNTIDEGARVAGGWAGAYAGAKTLGTLGAGLGTMVAPGMGTVVGGAIGGFLGGMAGYLGGSALGQWAADQG